MSLDLIFVIALALLFYGGIALLVWRSRRRSSSAIQAEDRPTEKETQRGNNG